MQKSTKFTIGVALMAIAGFAIAAMHGYSTADVAAVFGMANGSFLAFGPLVRSLQAKQGEAVDTMKELSAILAERDFTADEQAKYDAAKASAEGLKARIAIAMESELASAGLQPQDATPTAAAPRRGEGSVVIDASSRVQVIENVDADPNRGFKSIGDYLLSVRGATNAARRGMQADTRLAGLAGGINAAALPANSYANEGNGEDGGYLVPPGFSTNIFRLSLEEQALLPMTDGMTIAGNTMTLPTDETTPWGSDGIRASWEGEGDQANPTKPKIGRSNYRLKKLMALVPMTEELLADGVGLGAYFQPAAARSIRWKTDEAILFGGGDESPLGAFTGSIAVSVAKEASQAAATINVDNVTKMIARLPAGAYGQAVWLVNNDALPQIFTMKNGDTMLWMASSSGVQGSPYGTLLGRPVMVSQHAKTVGTVGDIMLADFTQYRSMTKAGGIQTATSMHLYFDADATAFRATFRVDGKPKLSAPISPANGSNTLSPFVQLATRA